jgi:pimeloyl-ACP methyl ester carboxylesterase
VTPAAEEGRWGVKYDDRYAEVAGVRTRFWQAGHDGQAVVLIHGIACSVEDWEANIGALAQSHRVFALDLVGCGLSDKPGGQDYSLRALARFVLDFMSAIGIDAAHLMGFSMGGRLALECAHMAPERVRSLVLLAPAAIGPDTIINFRLASVKGLGELLTRPSRFGMRMLMRAAFSDPSKISADMLEDRLRRAKLPGAQAAFLIMLRGMVRLGGFHPTIISEVQSWLPSIRKPVLVIWGLQDRFVSSRHAEILRERLPDCTVKLYENCGHLPGIEQAGRLNADATAFLAGLEGR